MSHNFNPRKVALPDATFAWIAQEFSSVPIETIFTFEHLSSVVGLALENGKRIVIKTRPFAPRLLTCFQVQRELSKAGFPAPMPLLDPKFEGESIVTVEEFMPGGQSVPTHSLPEVSAAGLTDLVSLTAGANADGSLDPSPPWVAWDHPNSSLWPPADDRPEDLNNHDHAVLDGAARRVRERLSGIDLPLVIGHGDWWTANVSCRDGEIKAVYDWDSLVSQPESAIAGAASAVFPVTEPGTEATVEESSQFLEAYARRRGRPWNTEEYEVCWAAGLWVRLFDGKKESLDGEGKVYESLHPQLEDRLRRAGCA
ncbi:MAG: phosphotransferase [Actinobacteria bacterium]|nr:phosphotransferase [Actinomycetota bacterium]